MQYSTHVNLDAADVPVPNGDGGSAATVLTKIKTITLTTGKKAYYNY